MISPFSGHLTTMSDVYSFGVVLLELLTGRRALDKSRSSREQNLVAWASPFLKNPKKIERIIDPRLKGIYSAEGAKRMAMLAYQCLSDKPGCRPRMSTVVKTLEPVMELADNEFMPFVYIVPEASRKKGESRIHENEGENDHNGKETERDGDSRNIRQLNCPKGLRHKHRLNQAVHSDNCHELQENSGANAAINM